MPSRRMIASAGALIVVASGLLVFSGACSPTYTALMLRDSVKEGRCGETVIIDNGRGKRCTYSREVAENLEGGAPPRCTDVGVR